MLINRIILVLLIAASGVFASYYGGNVSYALFYMMLSIPVVSFFYTFYVYTRFRLYQEIGQRVVVKGDLTPYSFTLANEDYITYRSIKVNFLYDYSTISNAEKICEYCLLPGQSETLKTSLCCNYRGEYFIGASSVEIIDFLYLFKITYPIHSKLKVTVLPRVVALKKLGFAPPMKDVKNPPYLLGEQENMDTETRKYQRGDLKKQIHWKVSAKRNQIFSRKYLSDPKSEVLLFMDLSPVEEGDLINLITEDKIIESTLAIANYYQENHTRVTIYFEQDGIQSMTIRSKMDFDLFYQLCVGLHFHGKRSLKDVIADSLCFSADDFYILITHKITYDLYQIILKIMERGNELSLLFIKDNMNGEEEDIINGLRLAGITNRQVTREDRVEEVLRI